MKIRYSFSTLLCAALLLVASCIQAQIYTDVYGSYNYKGSLNVADTTFVKRFIAGDCMLDSSALAQFNSTHKGILVPRLTSAQMDSIINPANGLLVYNVSSNYFYYYNDSAWVVLGSGSGSVSQPSDSALWTLTGNTGTSSLVNYIGTADNNGIVFKTANVPFGYIDSLQKFNFLTTLDSNVYGVQTSNNIAGYGINGVFLGNQTDDFGLFEIDGTPIGMSGPILIGGSLGGSQFIIRDSALSMQSLGSTTIKGRQSVQLQGDASTVTVSQQQINANTPLVTVFNQTILPNNVGDSSKVYANIVLDGGVFGNNTLSGGALLSENILYDPGSSCVGNTLVGHGSTGTLVLGLFSNDMHIASHLDSNYMEGLAQMDDLGKHSTNSSFSHNYLKNLMSPVHMSIISGESFESVDWDTITGGGEISRLNLMNSDSVSYNVLSGPGSSINDIIMQNSDLNYCHLSSAGSGIGFCQLYNSRIINDTVSISNCFFHNVTKDFGAETQGWSNVMLLNDNVGIGFTTKPTASLQVGDSASPQSFRYVDGNQAAGKVLTSDISGNASWQLLGANGMQQDSTSYFTPASGATVSVTPYRYNIIDSTGTLSNLTISLPLSPVEGEWVEIKLAQSGVTMYYANGTVANSAPGYIQALNLYIKLVFRASNSTWY